MNKRVIVLTGNHHDGGNGSCLVPHPPNVTPIGAMAVFTAARSFRQ